MSNQNKTIDKVEIANDLEPEIDDVLRASELPVPSMNVGNTQVASTKEEEPPVITNNGMVDMYKKIFSYIEDDRGVSTDLFQILMDLNINGGDVTDSTKEAMVQILKIRNESTDKMTKVMDLLMRYILKERDTFPRYLNAHQENNFNFKGGNKRSFLDKLDKQKSRKVEDKK